MHKCGREGLPLRFELVQPQLDGQPAAASTQDRRFSESSGAATTTAEPSFFRVLKLFELVLCYFIAAIRLLDARNLLVVAKAKA